jgi:hypothetical protein
MVGVYVIGVNVEPIAKVLIKADIFSALITTIFQQIVSNLAVPTKLTIWEKKDIAQRWVKWMIVSDSVKGWAILPVENDILGFSRCIAISWKNDCNLPNSSIWKIIATPVTVFLETQHYATLLFRRHVLCQFKCMLVHANSRMVVMKHVQKGCQDVFSYNTVTVGICRMTMGFAIFMFHLQAIIKGSLWVIDVELRIDRRNTIWRE